jgi:hypothetical protein
MNPRVKKVYPLENYRLHLIFTNGEEKVFDVKPYLETGIFKALKDIKLFNSVRPFLGSVIWEKNIDLCPDTLYMEGKKYSKKKAGLPVKHLEKNIH